MRLGLDVAQHHLEWDELLKRVRFAEEAGFDGAWVFDHFQALYGDRRGPCMEPRAAKVPRDRPGHSQLCFGYAWPMGGVCFSGVG